MSEKENKNKPNIKVVKLGTWFFPVVVISIILLINLFNGGLDMNYPKTTSISSFYDLLNKNQIEKVDILNKVDDVDKDDLFYAIGGLDKQNNVKPVQKENIYFFMISLKDKEKHFNKIYIDDNHDLDTLNLDIDSLNIYTNYEIIKSHSLIVHNNEEKIVYLTKNNRLFINNQPVDLL